MRRFLRLVFVFAIVGCASASARGDAVRALTIEHPLARATPPGAHTGAAFLTISNQGKETDRLIRATSPVAGRVEVHEMHMDNGVMRMRAVTGIEVKPGQTVTFNPGSLHLMLLDLKRPLKAGDQFPLILTFEKEGTVEVAVQVEALVGPSAAMPKR